MPFAPADLQHPQPALVQKVFEWFAELLMNATRETVEPVMRAAARDVCGDEHLDLVPLETRNLMGFFTNLRKLLVEVRFLVAGPGMLHVMWKAQSMAKRADE